MRTTLLVLAILFTPTLATADAITTAHPNWQWVHDQQRATKGNVKKTVQFRSAKIRNSSPKAERLPRFVSRMASVFNEKAQEAKQYFVRLGYTPHVAAAITGHLVAESRLNTKIRGDGGMSVGIAQWNGRRLVNLKRFAAERGEDWHDFETQLAFIDHELRTSERLALESLKKSRNVQEATVGFMHFERPQGYTPRNPARGHSFSKRLQNANVIYAAWKQRQIANMTP